MKLNKDHNSLKKFIETSCNHFFQNELIRSIGTEEYIKNLDFSKKLCEEKTNWVIEYIENRVEEIVEEFNEHR